MKSDDLINFSPPPPPPRPKEPTHSKSGSVNEVVANGADGSQNDHFSCTDMPKTVLDKYTSREHEEVSDNRGTVEMCEPVDELYTDNGQASSFSGTSLPFMRNTEPSVASGPVSGITVMISKRNTERPDNRPSNRPRYGKEQPSQQLRVISTGSPEEDNDDDFVIHVKRRTKRFYVGGFLPSITEKKLINYAARRGITLTWVNIHRYEHQNRAVIRVNVEATKAGQLLEEGFWPKGVMCRPWLSKGQFRNRYQNTNSRNGDDWNDGAEAHVAQQSEY